jgi:hypothetical protein
MLEFDVLYGPRCANHTKYSKELKCGLITKKTLNSQQYASQTPPNPKDPMASKGAPIFTHFRNFLAENHETEGKYEKFVCFIAFRYVL